MSRGWWRDPGRTVAVQRRLILPLTPTARRRLVALAAVQCCGCAQLARAAIESWLSEDAPALPPAFVAARPPPERATGQLTVRVTPETFDALQARAAQAQATRTSLVRSALDALAHESGTPPLFAARGPRTRWRGPSLGVPGIAHRAEIGLTRPVRFMRRLRPKKP